MNDCRHFEPELGALTAGELGDSEAGEVRAHLEECAACREELSREEFLRDALGSLPTVQAPAALDARLARVVSHGEKQRPAMRMYRRMTAAAFATAAALAVFLLAPGPWNISSPDWTEEEIAAGREDVLFTLALTARIIDHTRKDTLVDVFADRLPQAINDSFKMNKSDNNGGNG